MQRKSWMYHTNASTSTTKKFYVIGTNFNTHGQHPNTIEGTRPKAHPFWVPLRPIRRRHRVQPWHPILHGLSKFLVPDVRSFKFARPKPTRRRHGVGLRDCHFEGALGLVRSMEFVFLFVEVPAFWSHPLTSKSEATCQPLAPQVKFFNGLVHCRKKAARYSHEFILFAPWLGPRIFHSEK